MPLLRLSDFDTHIRFFIGTELIICDADGTVFVILIRTALIFAITYRLRFIISRYSAIPGAFIGTAFCILFGAAFGASLRAALRSFFRASLGTVFCIFLRTDISFTFAGCLLRTFLRFGFFGFFCFFGKSTDCVVPIYRKRYRRHGK